MPVLILVNECFRSVVKSAFESSNRNGTRWIVRASAQTFFHVSVARLYASFRKFERLRNDVTFILARWLNNRSTFEAVLFHLIFVPVRSSCRAAMLHETSTTVCTYTNATRKIHFRRNARKRGEKFYRAFDVIKERYIGIRRRKLSRNFESLYNSRKTIYISEYYVQLNKRVIKSVDIFK